MRLKYKYLSVILILLNIILMYNYLNEVITNIKLKESYKNIKNSNNVYSLIGTKLKYFDSNLQTTTKSVLKKEHKIVGVFSNEVCGSCIQDEIQSWYDLREKFDIQIITVFQGEGSPNLILTNLLKKYKFACYDYSIVFNKIENLDGINNPITLLLDSHNKVISSHIAYLSESDKSKLFYDGLNEYFCGVEDIVVSFN